MNDLVHVETHDDVLVLRLANGMANLLDEDLCPRLSALLAAAAESDHRAVVLVGNGRVFSAGADLTRVVDGGREHLRRQLSVLSRLLLDAFAFPKPLVAAVDGHAIAGGAVLAAACDHVVMTSGATIGVVEVTLGVPLPATALEILRFRVGTGLSRMTFDAERMGAAEALALGLVDEVAPLEEVLGTAFARAGRLAQIPEETFSYLKDRLRGGAVRSIRDLAADDDRRVVEVWSCPTVRASLLDYARATLRR
ncbi:enoyl-CoA hydratase/isomerase family protein [Actinokineospora sp. 24-640]